MIAHLHKTSGDTKLQLCDILRANPCKNRPKSSIRGKAQKIKIALLLHSGRPK